jgi:hypothetical protein
VGQIIVLPQPVAYDIGYEMDGMLYLLLSYGESRSKNDNGDGQENAPFYLNTEFSIAAVTSLPATPWVELARVQRSSKKSAFTNAINPAQPVADEIDLRFRSEVNGPREVGISVCYLGQIPDNKAGQGVGYMAQAVNHQGRYQVTIEDGATIGPGIVKDTLVYLIGQGDFELNSGVMNGLRNYVQRAKGTLFIESLDSKAEKIFTDFLNTVNITVAEIQPRHRLLTNPYLFSGPPTGFDTQGSPKMLAGEGVIFSTYKYGLVWQGERNGRLASREEIRTATEFGSNLIAYAEERRRMSG